jgi:hypothetical protein
MDKEVTVIRRGEEAIGPEAAEQCFALLFEDAMVVEEWMAKERQAEAGIPIDGEQAAVRVALSELGLQVEDLAQHPGVVYLIDAGNDGLSISDGQSWRFIEHTVESMPLVTEAHRLVMLTLFHIFKDNS